jgi:hypothetical protein
MTSIQLALTTFFSWLCKLISSWILACQFVLVPSQSSSTPSSRKCYELRSVPQLSFSFVISFWDPPLGLLKSSGAHHYVWINFRFYLLFWDFFQLGILLYFDSNFTIIQRCTYFYSECYVHIVVWIICNISIWWNESWFCFWSVL